MQDFHYSPLTSPVAQRNTPQGHHMRAANDFENPQAFLAREIVTQEENYECCPNCSRKFFVGRLKLHLKSCKEGKAHKPVKVKPIPERATEESELVDPNRRISYEARAIAPANQKEHEQENQEEEEDEVDTLDLKDREKAEDGRIPCSVCERLFHVNRILKHEKACKKSSKKRPVFDTSKQRAVPEQQGNVMQKAAVEPSKAKKAIPKEKASPEMAKEEIQNKEENGKTKANWKKQHENFIENIRFNRKLKQMEANGEDTTGLVAPTIVNDTYVSCSYCFRKFAPATAERHIPKCKDIFNRPKPPKSLRLQKIENSKVKVILRQNVQHTEETDTYTDEELSKPITAKTQQGKSFFEKAPSSESKRKNMLPSIRGPEPTEGAGGYEINLTPQKLRSFRSQSPMAREIKKVFTEPMPKKEDLLQNYQSLLARASHFATEPCPYCQRRFGHHAAERHVPVCKEINSRIRGKKSEGQNIFEEKKKPQMCLTSFATKIGFANKLLENEATACPRSTHNASDSTNYKPFLAGKKYQRSEKQLLPLKKLQGDMKEFSATKSGLLQKPKLNAAGLAHFCTSCGSKLAKVHNFCGGCGHKKDPIYIA